MLVLDFGNFLYIFLVGEGLKVNYLFLEAF